MNFIDRFRIEPSQPIRLRDIGSQDTSPRNDATGAQAETQQCVERLRAAISAVCRR